MRDWRQLDRAITMAALAPTNAKRDRALGLIALHSGLSRKTINRRVERLGFDVREVAGEKALKAYERTIRLDRTYKGIVSKLLGRVENIRSIQRAQMNRGYTVYEVAKILRVDMWTLRMWILHFAAFDLDRHNKISGYEIHRFMRSDFKWLVPVAKMRR